jgi:tetratricopeptide (TPR) repeat protein
MKRGLLYKDQGDWEKALADFNGAVQTSPLYAEAYREKGVAENKKYNGTPEAERTTGMPTGEASLRRAVELNPQDFDALSALGGVLKREGRLPEAAEVYAQATDISRGHTYPLLNEIKIRAHVAKKFELDGKRKLMVARAKNSLKVQVENQYNAPWSAFDMAEICLYSNDSEGFLKYLDEGLVVCTAKWQPETFRRSLELLTSAGITLPGLAEGIAKLKEAEDFL